ncbi:MAG: flavodoxin [Rubrivivax sp.]|nr:flavodoxin [Rubrivivax sp.]
MRRILLVYYSRTGTTRELARQIAALCGADLEEIQDRVGRGGALGLLRSLAEALLHICPPISPSQHAPRAYDLVIIGTPVWAGQPASPVRSYVRRHHDSFRRVALFCTCSGDNGSAALQPLQRLCGQPARAALALSQADIANGQQGLPIGRFLRRMLGRHAMGPQTEASRAA